ncbi:nucleotidyltransferase domain-containing protein [Prevotella sp. A2931]|uniref:Nucleotidyltransferase domain-containing protein n=1 Tax=Prevotella illustrans TaxID=2800387 RepID=A0ABS3M2X7_9BACT|nr:MULTISPECIES: nucleotidyltransferase domain-containing protein [Prevotella]MBO1362450.1 nucleotidyltransferase domain-containing protein [Prevotella illustrans]PTL25037.1 nucleotidyltransferase domain-containing protein [Prevotella sp. oral taxon 820]
MDKQKAIEIVKRYKAEIEPWINPTAVYLYGSYSRDEAREDSDIDVAVVVSDLKADWLAIMPQLWKAGWKVSSLIEPVLINEAHPSPLYEAVRRDGVAV